MNPSHAVKVKGHGAIALESYKISPSIFLPHIVEVGGASLEDFVALVLFPLWCRAGN